MNIAPLYLILALIAMAANIGAQDLSTRLYTGPGYLIASVVLGTGVGLVVKYLLDKRYIFRFKARNAAHDGQTFVLYVVMGIVTTAIFFAFEFGFQWAFGTRAMRYAGAVLGLAIGYVVKYHLDKRFVFVDSRT